MKIYVLSLVLVNCCMISAHHQSEDLLGTVDGLKNRVSKTVHAVLSEYCPASSRENLDKIVLRLQDKIETEQNAAFELLSQLESTGNEPIIEAKLDGSLKVITCYMEELVDVLEAAENVTIGFDLALFFQRLYEAFQEQIDMETFIGNIGSIPERLANAFEPYLQTLDYQAIADAINNILAGLQNQTSHRYERDVDGKPERTRFLLKVASGVLSGTPSLGDVLQPTIQAAAQFVKQHEPDTSSPEETFNWTFAEIHAKTKAFIEEVKLHNLHLESVEKLEEVLMNLAIYCQAAEGN